MKRLPRSVYGGNPRAGASGLRGFLGILSGSTLAQIMAFGALPLLARLYSPAETAHYALLLSASVVLAAVASFRLEIAIPLPARDEDSQGLFWLAVLSPLVVLPVVGLLALLVWIGWGINVEGFNVVDYIAVTAFVGLVAIFSAASQLAVRHRAYGVLGRIPVLQMLATLISQISLGTIGLSRGLFLGGLLGRSVGTLGLLRAGQVSMQHLPARGKAAQLLRQYWRFPAFFTPAALINVLGANLAMLMLPGLFGFGPAGLFAMAARITGVPAGIVIDAAGKVFLGEFARETSRSGALRVFFRWSALLASLGIAAAASVWVLAPVVLPWLLGDVWTGTAEIAQYSGLMAGAAILGSPLQNVWAVRQRGLVTFSWNVLRLSTTGAVLLWGADKGLALIEVIEVLAFATVAVYFLAWFGCLWAAARPQVGTDQELPR